MRSSYPTAPAPPPTMASVVINDLSSQKSTTTLLHSPQNKRAYHPHLYNYWTLNERLRSKNEKLSRRQQSSCRVAFYSVCLFVFAGVMAIIVYRFTDDCSVAGTPIDEHKQWITQCLRHTLFLAALCISFFSCTGLIYGACRYFRSQPQALLPIDQQELRLTHNYDLSPLPHVAHTCCCHQAVLTNGAARALDEHSNNTMSSSLLNISPQRKVPPFTYEELPPTQSISSSTRPLPPLSQSHVNCKSRDVNQSKSAFFSSSTSTSSSPQSVLSTSNSANRPISSTQRKSTLTFEDACPSTPTSFTTCVCATDVWERQAQPSLTTSPRWTSMSSHACRRLTDLRSARCLQLVRHPLSAVLLLSNS